MVERFQWRMRGCGADGGKLAGYRESWEQAVQAAAEGATVLVGNTRAARGMLHAAQERMRRGHGAWETPRVLPLAVSFSRRVERVIPLPQGVWTPTRFRLRRRRRFRPSY